VSEWADSYRRLSPESSSEPGQWTTGRAEYQRGMMDAFCEPRTHTIVMMLSSQVGKTEILNNVLAYYIDQDPAPILLLQPSIEMAEAWSKDRFSPMLRDTVKLHGKVKEPRTRDSSNTVRHKSFPGGHITVAGSNSPASLASRPIRIVLCDEVDRYPVSAGTEGDPVALAHKRSTTFWNRKLGLCSTPTIKGRSRIEAAFAESDQRRFWVPCPHCGAYQLLVWHQVKWSDDDPDTAAYACVECGVLWTDAERWRSVNRGEWRAGAEFRGTAGFHLNELYSPWVKLRNTVAGFLSAKKFPDLLQVWTNTALAEAWEETGETVEPSSLMSRVESFGPHDIPDEALALFCGVDTQDNRLEAQVIAWGHLEEVWVVEYRIFYGDPAQMTVWEDLDEWLKELRTTASGRAMRIYATCVDSQGHHSAQVYRFCRERRGRRIYATKGAGGPRPVWPKRQSMTKGRDSVAIIGVDTAKEAIYTRLGIKQNEEGPTPGYIHFSFDLDGESYFNQLTAESAVTRFREGRPYRVWVVKKGRRNEVLDTFVQCMAARHSVAVPLERLTAVKVAVAKSASPPPASSKVVEASRRVIRSTYV